MKQILFNKSFTFLRTIAAVYCIVVAIAETDANYYQGQQQVYPQRQQQTRAQNGRFAATVQGEGSSVNYRRCNSNSGGRSCVNYNLQGEHGSELQVSEVATSTFRPVAENRGSGYLPQGSQGRANRNQNGGNFHSSSNGREESSNYNGNHQNQYENGQQQTTQTVAVQPEKSYEKFILIGDAWGNPIIMTKEDFYRESRISRNDQGTFFRICELIENRWNCNRFVNNSR